MMAGIVAPKLPARDDAKNARDDANARTTTHAIAQTRANGTNRRTTERAVIEKNQLLNESAPTSSSSPRHSLLSQSTRSPLPRLSTFHPPEVPPPLLHQSDRGRSAEVEAHERYREQHLREGIRARGEHRGGDDRPDDDVPPDGEHLRGCDDARLTQEELNDRHLEAQSRGEEQHEHELEVLIDGPERLHRVAAVSDEEFERRRREDRVREIDPRVKEHGGPEHDGTEELSLILGQAREDVRDRLVQHHGSA